MFSTSYPLETTWSRLHNQIEKAPVPLGLTKNAYLDIAERIIRSLVDLQELDGHIMEPYAPYYYEEAFSTARFAGALGQLIKAGRCLDLQEPCVRAVEYCLDRIENFRGSPEFWVKELMYAWDALKSRLPLERIHKWEEVWRKHDPQNSYQCLVLHTPYNYTTFAMVGEFLKFRHGFISNLELVEKLLADEITQYRFSAHGLYKDPYLPMTYALTVNQQWDFVLHLGYDGKLLEAIKEISRRAGLSFLLMQSTTGQAPFGGRSNQYHFVEGHLACFFETRASHYAKEGDFVMAGAFKRAARNALKCVWPWIMDMEPFRHLKHGFHPSAAHGIDSGGTYSVYGALCASLFATAYHLANDAIREYITPAELGGYVFNLEEFHKIFATCEGYHLEIETKADLADGWRKDSTGLGRIHKNGIFGETAISGTIVANPSFTIGKGIEIPQKNLAFGPAWKEPLGKDIRLADFGPEISTVKLKVIREDAKKVAFVVTYRGNFGLVKEIHEYYTMSSDGISYCVKLDNPSVNPVILIPLLVSDGQEKSCIKVKKDGFDLLYRNVDYRVIVSKAVKIFVSDDSLLANRNGLYATGVLETNKIERIILGKDRR